MFTRLQAQKTNTDLTTPWRKSLRFRMLLLSSIIFGLMVSAIVFNSILIIKRAMIEHIRVSTKQTSEILHLAVAPYSSSNDFETLNVFLNELITADSKQSGLVYLVVGNEDGSLLLTSGHINKPLPNPDHTDQLVKAVSRGIVHIRAPLLLAHNAVGFMQYGLSFNLMLAATNQLNRDSILLGIAGLGIIIFIMLYVILKSIRRIYALAHVSKGIVSGDFSQRAQIHGQDEIAMLSRHFNLMADSIQGRIQDITNLNQALEARVEERTIALVDVNNTLEKTIENLKWTQDSLIRSEKLAGLGALVAGIAHELNTPIGNALTVASTLQDYTQTISDEFNTALSRSSLERFLHETANAGEILVRNLQKTAELVTSFKHVAVDQTSENRREFDLRTTLAEIIATLSPLLKNTPYRIKLNCSTSVMMNSYPGALGQIITNLLTNAIAHAFSSRSQGNMNLDVSLLDNQEVKLVFSDNGAGMTAETLQHIFDPFFTTRLGKGGSGLGMSIVHNLVTVLLGGTIQVKSQEDQGTEFTLYFPIKP